MAKRSAEVKKRWGYGELSLADIVQAASRLVREVGVARVTMRAISRELGASSMSIYYYVPNKETLLDLVIDDAYSHIELPSDDSGPWDERLRRLIRNARRELGQYPGLPGLMQVRPVPPHGVRLGEAADRFLREGGFADDESRRYALQTLISYLFGALAWEATRPDWSRTPPADSKRDEAQLDEWRYRQTMLSLDDLFEYGLDIAIVGLRHKALEERSSGRPPGPP